MNKIWIIIFAVLASFAVHAIEIKPAAGYEFTEAGYWLTNETDIQQVISFSDWSPGRIFSIPGESSHLWLKTTVDFQKTGINGLYISSLASFELYWEDRLIYRSGLVSGAETAEVPGEIDNFILLPQPAEKGEYTFYLRLSRHQLAEKYRHSMIDLTFNDYEHLLSQKYRQSLYPLLSLGALMVISIYYLSVYHSWRYRPYLLFSLLCIVVALWLLAENWRPLFGYTWQWHGTRLWLISLLSGVFAMLLPLFLAYEFDLRPPSYSWALQIPIFALLHTLVSSFDMITGLLVLQGFILSLAIMIRVRIKGNRSANWTILALLMTLLPVLWDPTDYLEQWFFVLFPLVIVALLHNLSLTMKSLKASREQAIALGKSLELQLIKNSIQPHFLLNTLTSLSEWIDKSPETAQEMLEKLAEEFYLLSTMVEKPLVSIEEELQLCRAHLHLMSLRKNCQFKLHTRNTQNSTLIPPGILHTLVENAFSHNNFQCGEFIFEVTQSMANHQTQLIIACPRDIQSSEKQSHQGTGSQYIAQRMQQAFAEQWTRSEIGTTDSWTTTLCFPQNDVIRREPP